MSSQRQPATLAATLLVVIGAVWLLLGNKMTIDIPMVSFDTDDQQLYGAGVAAVGVFSVLWMTAAVAQQGAEKLPRFHWYELLVLLSSWLVNLLVVLNVLSIPFLEDVTRGAIALLSASVVCLLLSTAAMALPAIRFARKKTSLPAVPIAAASMLLMLLIFGGCIVLVFVSYSSSSNYGLAVFFHPIAWVILVSATSLVFGWPSYAKLAPIFDAHHRSLQISELMTDRSQRPLSREDFPILTVPQREMLGEQLKKGLEPDTHITGGWTPLMMSAANGDVETAELLLRFGARVNHQNDMSRTALYYVSKYGNAELVRLLLDSGGDPNIGGAFDDSRPLLEVARNGNIEIAELLLAKGADATIKSAKGGDLVQLASDAKHGELAAVFRKVLNAK